MTRYPIKQRGLQHQRGFSLIEAMFSALILAVALLALAGFHVGAFQDSTLVKGRMAATNLAQEKLDDLRSFIRLKNDPATGPDECAAGTFCFSEILANVGGKEKADGTLELPTGAVSGFQDAYDRTWTVTCATTEPSGSALTFGTTCTDAIAKLVTVTVAWTDSKGADQKVELQSAIYSMDPANGANAAVGPVSGKGPKISYTPIGVSVPINIGTGEKKESSKPVPEVKTQGIGAEVSFDAISYVSNGAGFDITRKEEFVTVPCECEFNGTGTTGRAPSRMIWNDTELKLEAKVGAEVSKTVGVPSGIQNPACTACCRDHHDVAGQAQYDPDRPSSEYVGGNHKHYWYAACVNEGTTIGRTSGCTPTNKAAGGHSQVVTGAYLESCRFMRVDGFMRAWQDWRQVEMTVIPDGYLTGTKLDDYVAVIKAVVEDKIRTDSGNGSKTIPALSGRDITFSAVGQFKQLLARAVYVDRIYEAANPTTLDAAYYTKLVTLIGSSSDWLFLVPFYEVNLALLTDWSSNLPATASVTKEDIVEGVSYSRGNVTAVSSGSATITATTRLHNTGVTGGISLKSPSFGISGYDNTPISYSISVTVP